MQGGRGAPIPSSLALLLDPNLHKCSRLRLLVRFCASVIDPKWITRLEENKNVHIYYITST